MIRPEDRHRVGKARLLRRQGKTYDEIRAHIGPVNKDLLADWLRGIPRPPATNRSGRTKPDLRRKARQLRAEGMTIGEISVITGAGKGSISPWIRDIRLHPRAEAKRQARIDQLRGKGAKAMHDKARQRELNADAAAHDAVGVLTPRDILLIGATLYWAEGTKDKPWRRLGGLHFTNSDPSVLRLFLAWLDVIEIAPERRRYRLAIHESADPIAQQDWWADELGLDRGSFLRPTLKRHNPKPSRHNTAERYHGCLVISVLRSREIYNQIAGTWHAIDRSANGNADARNLG